MSSKQIISSSKTRRDENFPVGSRLLAARLRPHIIAYYAFARTADDIADAPQLAAEDKIGRLEALWQALDGGKRTDPSGTAHRLRASLESVGVAPRHALDLLRAFKLDATKLRYHNWQELIDYCNHSAAPVGRFLLDLHSESSDIYPNSDALCNALQILNHLQDCRDDYLKLDRVYIPQTMLLAHRAEVCELAGWCLTRSLRAVIDEVLANLEPLLAQASTLPKRLRSRRLALEALVTVKLARRLAYLLRVNDPLATRVKLTKMDFVRCGVSGVLTGLWHGWSIGKPW